MGILTRTVTLSPTIMLGRCWCWWRWLFRFPSSGWGGWEVWSLTVFFGFRVRWEIYAEEPSLFIRRQGACRLCGCLGAADLWIWGLVLSGYKGTIEELGIRHYRTPYCDVAIVKAFGCRGSAATHVHSGVYVARAEFRIFVAWLGSICFLRCGLRCAMHLFEPSG